MTATPWFNPFDAPELASGYEAWYETEGRAADQAERRLIRWLLSGLSRTQTLLEIGVGTGHFARWLVLEGFRVVGVDRSAPMLAEAWKRGGVPLVRADAASLPFADDAFDASLLITTLEFVPSPERALQEAARVAREGVILGVLNRWHPMAWQRKRSGLPVWQIAHFYSPPELARLVREALPRSITDITWRTTLLPGPFMQSRSSLPLGAFIGMRVALSKQKG
ncbi:MAG: class I SAM-dependent methyltransferase [Roseiflexus sp.]|nr:class I SAM-dependent methyltransferase [Roseiflexus sp.]MCS7289778.1 class I SAM-dependent methyltransferase [Roseiflexus sp.]MDW8145739.1 class I SAM-dependent methyltransferase [Roseiflexaceae bacterium]MDW8232507.1 class I SAM-dependent methyltransferase [Roseiflexaceae bacterium]